MWYRYLKKTFQLVGWSVLLIGTVRTFVLDSGIVNGRSMENTLIDNQTFLVNKMTLLFREPKRGEIVQARGKSREDVLVKRVIGIPGDRISMHGGSLYLLDQDGAEHLITELYLKEQRVTFSQDNKPFVTLPIPPHTYFLLGDNRVMSIDSRAYGTVHRSDIYGLVLQVPFLR